MLWNKFNLFTFNIIRNILLDGFKTIILFFQHSLQLMCVAPLSLSLLHSIDGLQGIPTAIATSCPVTTHSLCTWLPRLDNSAILYP